MLATKRRRVYWRKKLCLPQWRTSSRPDKNERPLRSWNVEIIDDLTVLNPVCWRLHLNVLARHVFARIRAVRKNTGVQGPQCQYSTTETIIESLAAEITEVSCILVQLVLNRSQYLGSL
jgi:hypothetical protein